MDVNSPQWDAYMSRFQAVAEQATVWEGQRPNLADSRLYLCLFGENGLTEAQEFALLETLASSQPLYQVVVDTNYWQEIVLFVPRETDVL